MEENDLSEAQAEIQRHHKDFALISELAEIAESRVDELCGQAAISNQQQYRDLKAIRQLIREIRNTVG